MRVAILNLTAGGLSGGYRKYLQRLLPLLESHPRIDQLHVFVPPGINGQNSIPGQRISAWPAKDHISGYPWLKAEMQHLSPQVIFIPTAQWLAVNHIPVVNMVRNMEPLLVPFAGNPFLDRIKNMLRAYVAKKAVRRSQRTIAVSRHVREFLLNRWDVASDKVGMVYHGVDAIDVNPPVFPSDVPAVNPEDRMLFTAGSIRPARGLEDLITALGYMGASGIRCRLVIAGAVDPGMQNYRNKLDDLIKDCRISGQVHWAGPLTAPEMERYYRHCDLFVMTSRAEACPNTALEAMAYGCVCISTDTPPMPEFFDKAACYYPARDGKRLAERISDVLTWGDRRQAVLSATARARAAQFSWSICAERTVEELEKAVTPPSERYTR